MYIAVALIICVPGMHLFYRFYGLYISFYTYFTS